MEKNRQTVYSPDGQVAFAFSCDGGKPTYRVTYKGEAVYDTAPLGHRIGGTDYHEGVSLREVATDKKAVELPLFGRMKTVRTAFNEAVWTCGVRTALAHGGVVNDHHGVGIKLGRLMKEQYGPAMQVFEGLKKTLDPNGIMNPFKLGL